MADYIATLALMKLHFQFYQSASNEEKNAWDASAPIVIIPGLFGSSSNWRAFAKTLSQNHSVYVIDQRNHGRSPHANDNRYFDLANDLAEFLRDQGLAKAIIMGHSMGGKTAMVFALLYPEQVADLIVLDIAPVFYEYQSSHEKYLKAMMQVDLAELQSRSAAESQLTQAVPESAIRLFLMLNLAGKPSAYFWRLNLPVLLEFLPEICDFPSELVEGRKYGARCLFLRGANSDYLADDNAQSVYRYFPSASIEAIADAGHWLHIDQAEAVIERINALLLGRSENM